MNQSRANNANNRLNRINRKIRFRQLLSRLKTEGKRELVREGRRVARNAARQQIRRATGFYF